MDNQHPLVFLGGECGVSTWRTDTAIPLLETAGITYHNPQVGFGQWRGWMLSAENEAKAHAQYMLMVVGSRTRGIATIQEITSLAMRYHNDPLQRRDLFVVIDDIVEGTVIGGFPVVGADLSDANRGRVFLRDDIAAWRPDLVVYPKVRAAVEAIICDYQLKGDR